MRVWPAIVAFLVLSPPAASAQVDAWHVDVGGMALVEAWDVNQQRESLAGVTAGVERRVWQTLGLRLEGWIVRAFQTGDDAWVRGFGIGPRWRWGSGNLRPFVDLAVGLSHATAGVPPGGTQFNYAALAGGGFQIGRGRPRFDVGARWLHLSNNGRESRARNPDVQALGAVVAIGWSY